MLAIFRILILVIILWLFVAARAQNYSEFIAQSLEQNDIMNLILPLQSLIDSAEIHSPMLKIAKSDVTITTLRLKSEKLEWTRNVGFEAGIRYGLFDNLILKEQSGSEVLQGSTSSQTRYNAGIFLKIPASSFIDRSNVKIAKEEEVQANYRYESSLLSLRQAVIVQYFEVVKIHKGLIIKNESVESYRVQLFRTEQDFINGSVGLVEFTRIKNMYTQALLDFEETKTDYFVAFRLLAEIVGIDIVIGKN